MKALKLSLLAAIPLMMVACQKKEVSTAKPDKNLEAKAPLLMSLEGSHPVSSPFSQAAPGNVSVYMVEYLTSGEGDQQGRTVYFNDRGNKQLSADFVPGLALDGTDDISYYVDNKRPSNDLPAAITEAAIDRAMTTWDNVKCSDLGMTKVPFSNAITTGFVSALLGYGGSFDYTADVVHAGWLPKSFFDALAPGGGDFILGATFTLVFTGTDVDNNGKADVAFRETYYNDAFTWQDGANFDVETIALHESGHGLSQGHFGSAFRTGNGKLHFAPRAVMNAAYSGIQNSIGKTDLGGHCSNWAAWPNK